MTLDALHTAKNLENEIDLLEGFEDMAYPEAILSVKPLNDAFKMKIRRMIREEISSRRAILKAEFDAL